MNTFFACFLMVLMLTCACWAEDWEKEGQYYFLTKNNRDNFSLEGAGPNEFSHKYQKYGGINFLVRGPNDWHDYGRLNLEFDNIFSVPVKSGVKVEEVHLLAGGNYSNSYEHDKLMRLFGEKYFYATLSVIFIYEDGTYKELSVPVFWDWFHIGPGAWDKGGSKIKSLGENPVRKGCNMYLVSFINPKPLVALKSILITDSWIDSRPFSDVFALTLKTADSIESAPKKER